MTAPWRTLVAVLALAALPAAWAGRGCQEAAPDVDSISRGMALAQATAQALDASGAQVVLLARAGQDLGKYGLKYSHLGYAYRESGSGDVRWRVLHKLNHCGTASAALYRQGLGEFFLDRPDRYDAAFVALKPELQARLLPLLKDNARAATLHEPNYNMVSYVWGTRFQQSNQWAAETLALAADGSVRSRSQAQAWLQLKDYTPTTLTLRTLTRLGARATAANISFEDHPNDKRFSDRIETVTVDSIFDWLQRSGLGGAVTVVR